METGPSVGHLWGVLTGATPREEGPVKEHHTHSATAVPLLGIYTQMCR